MLSSHGFTPTMMETIVPKLGKHLKIQAASNKKNEIFRFMDMNYVFWKNYSNASLIFIDVFSTKAFFFAFIFSLFSRLLRIPYIPILRGGDLSYRIKTSPGLSRFVFCNSAINVTPSLFFKKRLDLNHYNMQYIPNFIQLDDYPFRLRKLLNPKLFWVRSFHKIYNPKMAIYVLYNILKEYSNAHLTMVGPEKDGSQKLCMDLAKDLGISGKITFTGLLPKKRWISLSDKSDIFINTTHVDNMPVSIIEALALGFPIVSTNIGGIPFLLKTGQNALLVKDSSINGMVEKIKLLLKSYHLSQMLSRNAMITSEAYSWEYVYPKWEKIIDTYSK